MCFGLNLFRLSVCLAALPHNLYSFQFLDAYPSKLRKSLLNDKKWYNILAIIHIFEHLVCVHSDSTGHQHSLPVFEASADVFSFQHGCRLRAVFFSLLRDETQSVVAWGPIKSRFHSCIRWHTYEDFFFFPTFGPHDESWMVIELQKMQRFWHAAKDVICR